MRTDWRGFFGSVAITFTMIVTVITIGYFFSLGNFALGILAFAGGVILAMFFVHTDF